MAMFIVKPWYRKKDDAIYGAEWAGGSDPSWVRTDAAVGFSAPNPYYAGMSTTPSSPFDNIMPWSGMCRVTDASAGELVEIPKFYYKWTRDGIKMKLQISMSAFDGSHVSPAHADRGDGVGERDYVYVGRYHCASDYKSKTGVTPKGNATISTFRTGVQNLRSDIWLYDYSTLWTVLMLYLVEYAHWNIGLKIGMGGIENSSHNLINTGQTDGMPYHTGTMYSSRDAQGAKVQYRYIENLWANGYQFIDGIYTQNRSVYVNNNPSNYASTGLGTLIANNIPALDWRYVTTSFTASPNTSGLEYAIFTNSVSMEVYKYYTCARYWNEDSAGKMVMLTGGQYEVTASERSNSLYHILFEGESVTLARWIARSIVLPSSRLSA